MEGGEEDREREGGGREVNTESITFRVKGQRPKPVGEGGEDTTGNDAPGGNLAPDAGVNTEHITFSVKKRRT